MSHYFVEEVNAANIMLSPEESKHLVKAMRKSVGDVVTVTDGKGNVANATIIDNHKSRVVLQIEAWAKDPLTRTRSLHLCVAPTKNPSRIEWLVEKAVEIGVEKITFMMTDHTERKHVDLERMKRLAVAALKQSGNTMMPEIDVADFQDVIDRYNNDTSIHKWFGHCNFEENNVMISQKQNLHNSFVILVGPEGDFSKKEIKTAFEANFEPIKLGEKVLRTETAAFLVVAAVSLF